MKSADDEVGRSGLARGQWVSTGVDQGSLLVYWHFYPR